jgi:hypothetical protein
VSLRLLLVAATSGVALAGGAWAANEPVSGLPARGAVAGTDQLPILPSGAASLQAAYASDLKKYALTSVDTFGADPTGVADSTAAINAAIASGQSLSCNGVYKTSATLVFSTVASHGQQVIGAGPTDNAGVTTAGRCIIKPTSAVSVVVKVDGTPFSGYVEGFGVENVTIDMNNMSDVNTSIAFDQVQGYDGHYRNDRVINYGNYKLSWSFSAGSYSTKVEDCQGGVVSFTGGSFINESTTISLINDDILQIYHDFYQNVTLLGGAIQRPYSAAVPISYLAPGTTPYGYVPNTAGLYVAVLSEIYDSQGFTSVGADWEQGGGYPSTYNDGTHGTLTLIRVLKVDATAIDTTFINPAFAGMYLLDFGQNTRVLGQQEGTVTGTDIHNGQDLELGTLGLFGTVTGVTNLANYLDYGTTTTWSITPGGLASFMGATVTPTADADKILLLTTAAGLNMVDFSSTAGQVAFENGLVLGGYSDTFTTQTWDIQSATGLLQLKAAGVATVTLTGANGTGVFTGGINSSPVGASTPSTGAFTTLTSASLQLGGKLVASSTVPTYSSGFSTGAPTIAGSTTGAFTVAIGATPGATGVLTMPVASTGWNCTGVDRTTAAANVRETATTASSVTFALASTVASDVLQFQCTGY